MDNANTTRRQTLRPSKRRLIQLYSALLHNAHLRGFIDGEIYRGKAKFACVPGLNCYSCPGAVGACPLGALQNALASAGHRAGWYMLGILLLFGTILGRTVCGWLCPLGLIQELLHRLPTLKLKKSRATRLLSYLKYMFLAVFAVAIPLWYGLTQDIPLPGFCKYVCPAGTLEGAVGLLSSPANSELFGMLGVFFTRKFVIMLIIALACIFCYRGFCRFVCPLGAIYGLFNRFCLVGVKVDAERCNGCGACVRSCGMDVRHVGDHECIHCAHCMEVCPQKAISLRAGSVTLKAPEGGCADDRPDPESRRRKAGKLARGAALAVLCFVLLWFNFLDPAVKPAAPAPAAAVSAEPAPAGEAQDAEQGLESGAPVGSEPGMQLGDFTIGCLDGSSFHLAETRGKVVILNLWATYCTPCVKELPYFDAFCREHADDVVMLAVHSSVVTDDPAAYVAGRGWTIPFAVDTEDDLVWELVNGSSTMPQTVVLDRRGEVVYNQKGSVTPEMLEALYAQAAGTAPAVLEVQSAATPAPAAPAGQNAPTSALSFVPAAAEPEPGEGYRIRVTDGDDSPIPGVTVQFCSETECVLGTTGADGVASFAFGAGSYTVHLRKVPAGYEEDDTEYAAPGTPGLMTLVLKTDKTE